MLQLKNSSAAFVAFILRVLTEDLELFREHDFSVFVAGGKLTLEIGVGGVLSFSTAKIKVLSQISLKLVYQNCKHLKKN